MKKGSFQQSRRTSNRIDRVCLLLVTTFCCLALPVIARPVLMPMSAKVDWPLVPEPDLPGHSRSWQIAYPELASSPGEDYRLHATRYIFSDPRKPAAPSTCSFLDGLLGEITTLLTTGRYRSCPMNNELSLPMQVLQMIGASPASYFRGHKARDEIASDRHAYSVSDNKPLMLDTGYSGHTWSAGVG